MNNESKRTGLLLAALAAIFFGLSSITAKMASIGAGGNGISIAFYRNLSVLPVLAAILKIKGYGFAVTKKQLVSLLFIGMTCGGLTAMLLYLSYDYISVGLTLCLHFLYPALVALFYAVFFKQKLTKIQGASLLLACLGIWVMMFGGLEANPLGLTLALLSSVAYSAYLIISDRSGVRELTGFKISFYNTLFGSIFLFVFGHIFGFSFTECRPAGWIWLFLTGLMVVCIGNVMTPEAVKRIGPTVTGILGILEPITSLVCSILLLGEPLTKRSLLGGILVLASAFLITLGDYKKGQE
ncbi:MAG: EamA family transporter [Firmicutes bacterium]|jgi:drug/metabolite transporter (DMT)-like permease|nr:EamA family transporter [Bacillota bacterium]MBR0516821.1 EamA family transporter [Bacillota bacterium]MBR3035538.1 EamA family transporter [Bacillota bacterium]